VVPGIFCAWTQLRAGHFLNGFLSSERTGFALKYFLPVFYTMEKRIPLFLSLLQMFGTGFGCPFGLLLSAGRASEAQRVRRRGGEPAGVVASERVGKGIFSLRVSEDDCVCWFMSTSRLDTAERRAGVRTPNGLTVRRSGRQSRREGPFLAGGVEAGSFVFFWRVFRDIWLWLVSPGRAA
jgi:hypothetical protein